MMQRSRHLYSYSLLPLLACSATLGGCATGKGDYPSLAIRDAERVEGQFQPVQPVQPPIALAPELDDALASAVARGNEAHALFMADVPATRQRVAAGRNGGQGSDSWSAAQIALANLESRRSSTAIPLADLDTIYADASNRALLQERIIIARNDVTALVAQEDSILAQLRSQMR
ncbi:MAG: hypothetical protein ACK5NN_04765 [Sphingomonadaceae bacterium]